ncbi:MAG: 9-O-acetylesterase, partial [Kiritimatiellaeota bacterium]|nr:9-O-acetylesterase [Kiritimatiellota bacterium]
MKHISALIAALLLVSLTALQAAELKLPALFSDHMVLQRAQAVPVWGWAKPGEEVTVEFAGQKKTAKADVVGKWLVKLDPMKASAEPRALIVKARVTNDETRITDVLVGDVWLCSGQSNMGFGVKGALNGEQEIANANYPAIRLFSVAPNPTLTPTNAVKGEWRQCSPKTVGDFSAVSFFFGRALHGELKIPIGLLHSSVGATPAEAWTRMEALSALPALAERAKSDVAQIQSQEEDNKRFLVERAAWEEKYGVKPVPVSEASRAWAAPDLDTTDWKTVTFPGNWKNFGLKSGGVFWIRKELSLPQEALKNTYIILALNWVGEQYDTVFLNGEEVAHVVEQPPAFYTANRSYYVRSKFAKPGRNVVAVRFSTATENAGMQQSGKGVFPFAGLKNTDDKWLMKVESTFAPLPPEALKSRPKPNILVLRGVPSSLYNGMIAPLVPFAIKGAIWYQGESNVTRPGEYRDLLSLMIGDWRDQWGQGDFPFYIVQLANYYGVPKEPGRSGIAEVREGQLQVSQRVPNTGLVVAIDIGEENIHPKNKQDVGKRLALVALEKTYGQKIESSGPRYDSIQIQGTAIRVKFTQSAGLVAKGGPLKMFALAGADKKFVWADAKIEGETVVVSSAQVPEPGAVRYAWADNPEGCNLYNAAG